MTSLLRKRLLAFLIDYLIIVLYAGTLFAITMVLFKFSTSSMPAPGPFTGQLAGFITLTLPVFLYFYISEKSKWKGTVGKRKLNIQVSADFSRKIFIRNVIKFLPWEIAHTGVHWLMYYSTDNHEIPLWNWTALIVPQIMVVVYICSIIFSGGRNSVYDKIAKTEISISSPNLHQQTTDPFK